MYNDHEKWATELEKQGKNPMNFEWSDEERKRLLALQGNSKKGKRKP